ncbi:MAG: zinc metalloprotease HtpX, partial [candidate division WOR-3 bacterium]
MRETLYSLISKNKLRTALFIIGFSLILAIVGYALTNIFHWGTSGYVLFGLFIIFYNLILYYNSDKLALAISGAK